MLNRGSSDGAPVLFETPTPAVIRHPSTLLSPRELRTWLEQLPLGNPPRAAGMLLQQLRLLGRDPQPGPRFGALLQLYRQPLDALLQMVAERMLDQQDCAVPLDQLERLVLEALGELAYALLRIANTQLAAGRHPGVEALFEPMSLLDQSLAIEHVHYQKVALDNWRLMQSIYLYAEKNAIADKAVKKPAGDADDPDTIHGLYLRTLLIGFCDPHRHLPSEVLAWRRWTGRHTGLLSFSLLPQGAASIPVDTSGGMTPLAAARVGKPGPEMRYLDIGGFLKRLAEDPEPPPGLRATLDDLVRGRRKPEQREAARQPRDHPFHLTTGLRQIHDRLSDLLLGRGAAGPERAVDGRQVNQSKTGAAFRVSGPLNPPLVIGEPLLAETPSATPGAPPVGFAARIQRLMVDDNDLIELGVEKIAGRILPVTLGGAAAERTRGDTAALLQHRSDDNTFTLIATLRVFREGDLVAVDGPGVRYNLRMQQLLGSTKRIAYIEVEPADP